MVDAEAEGLEKSDENGGGRGEEGASEAGYCGGGDCSRDRAVAMISSSSTSSASGSESESSSRCLRRWWRRR